MVGDINKTLWIQFIHADTYCLIVESLSRIELHVWIVAIGTQNRATTLMTLHGSVFTNTLVGSLQQGSSWWDLGAVHSVRSPEGLFILILTLGELEMVHSVWR